MRLHLDTFHMHPEEKDSSAAIRLAGQRLFYFHACENNRGDPGTGPVLWPAIAQAVSLWRPNAPDQDSIARDGLRFLVGLFDEE